MTNSSFLSVCCMCLCAIDPFDIVPCPSQGVGYNEFVTYALTQGLLEKEIDTLVLVCKIHKPEVPPDVTSPDVTSTMITPPDVTSTMITPTDVTSTMVTATDVKPPVVIPTELDTSPKSPTGLIVGLSVSGLILLVALILAVIIYTCRKRCQQKRETFDNGADNPVYNENDTMDQLRSKASMDTVALRSITVSEIYTSKSTKQIDEQIMDTVEYTHVTECISNDSTSLKRKSVNHTKAINDTTSHTGNSKSNKTEINGTDSRSSDFKSHTGTVTYTDVIENMYEKLSNDACSLHHTENAIGSDKTASMLEAFLIDTTHHTGKSTNQDEMLNDTAIQGIDTTDYPDTLVNDAERQNINTTYKQAATTDNYTLVHDTDIQIIDVTEKQDTTFDNEKQEPDR